MIINSSEVSLKKLDECLKSLEIPIEIFKQLLHCVIKNDFSELDDPVIQSRYRDCHDRVQKHITSVVYQDVYSNDGSYENFITFLIQVYAVIDTLVEGRLYISDISKQNEEIVNIFLESYGFDIHRIFDSEANMEIAKNIYYNLRRKGTPEIIETMLHHLGFTHFQIVEYVLNKKGGQPFIFTGNVKVDIEGPPEAQWGREPIYTDTGITGSKGGRWMFVPHKVLETQASKKWKFRVNTLFVNELDDPLWWLDEDDLHNIYNSFLEEGF
jgi:hypothetical protein